MRFALYTVRDSNFFRDHRSPHLPFGLIEVDEVTVIEVEALRMLFDKLNNSIIDAGLNTVEKYANSLSRVWIYMVIALVFYVVELTLQVTINNGRRREVKYRQSQEVLVDIPERITEHGLSFEITQSLGGSSNMSEGSKTSGTFEDYGRSDED
ncbi:hypothetical protein Tco_0628104 [Tanacetum coccineum]|uniref:Uncharacterized protein n=1 Tax=Tanacetum coccineum TaxID=301880 RepID=A0ABQ4WPC3_9ASTR